MLIYFAQSHILTQHPWWNGYHRSLRNFRSRFDSWWVHQLFFPTRSATSARCGYESFGVLAYEEIEHNQWSQHHCDHADSYDYFHEQSPSKLFMMSMTNCLDKTENHQSHWQQHSWHCDDYHILFQHANIYLRQSLQSGLLTHSTNGVNYTYTMKLFDWCIIAVLSVLLVSWLEWMWEINWIMNWLLQ